MTHYLTMMAFEGNADSNDRLLAELEKYIIAELQSKIYTNHRKGPIMIIIKEIKTYSLNKYTP